MGNRMAMLEVINQKIQEWVWGIPMLVLMGFTGVYMTFRMRGFQFVHIKHWMSQTIGSIFTSKQTTAHTNDQSISQFQSVCTALAATVGTGNIIGVASAIASGGPGAVFWMWVIAFFGMMTSYAETVLGVYYRVKNEAGEWSGGAMYYLRYGLGARKHCRVPGMVLAGLFAFFCLLASFGIGNMTQANSIASNLFEVFHVPVLYSGLVIMAAAGVVLLGGVKRLAAVTEKIVPFMVLMYVGGTLFIILSRVQFVPAAFEAIFRGAFGIRAAGGGVIGYGVHQAVEMGMKRGIFSNEAGLGSAVIAHANSNVKEPAVQGMWGIFEVFADTVVMCTMTALLILVSGDVDLKTGAVIDVIDASNLAASAFASCFGMAGEIFMALAILFFAFATILGWSHYGAKACEYLFGLRAVPIYKGIYIGMIFVGSVMGENLVWSIADTFNGLMAIPNLIGVQVLSGTVAAVTNNYIRRVFYGKKEKPLLSFRK